MVIVSVLVGMSDVPRPQVLARLIRYGNVRLEGMMEWTRGCIVTNRSDHIQK